ncbi:NADH dehydrogenase [ubiquinone] 1 alpha subcomplex assembly factor 3 [Andrena cerasifolii]|uniref:NADH dehydrogenase [ubiquinone] 1 alpha subcomplex assembly factor 3 n=1 Tax=Andrena cerasifolii TaxID=2819439 RepID=UPI0040379897
MVLASKLFTVKRLLRNVRQLHCSYLRNKYEGSGKTTVTILNLNNGPRVLIDQCTIVGFRMTDNRLFMGPVAVFPTTVLFWNVKAGKDINEGALSLFSILEPQPDIIVLGLETTYDYRKVKEIKRPLIEKGISVEVLPVEQACGIYNFLSEEGRYVVAGLIPPLPGTTLQQKRLKVSMEAIRNARPIGPE